MQRFIILLFLYLFTSLRSSAQNEIDLAIDIQIACGFAGVTSPSVHDVNKLVKKKAYSALKLKLFSQNKSVALLTFIAVKELQAKHALYLSTIELKQLNEIANQNDNYSLCYTCTGHFEGSTNELLTKATNPAYQLIKSAIFKSD